VDRDVFLSRVREAAKLGRRHRVHVQPPPTNVGRVGVIDDLPARLAAEIDAVGGKAWLVDDVPAARRCLAELIRMIHPATVLCWEHPLLDRLDTSSAVAAIGSRMIFYQGLAAAPIDEGRSNVLEAELGIAAADWAVAETGSVVVAARPGQERSVTLLPPVLISIVDSTRILPDLFDLFAILGEDDDGSASGPQSGPYKLPSSLVFITGPSKTGDIELQLTTGVHGPGIWHVIVIREKVAQQ